MFAASHLRTIYRNPRVCPKAYQTNERSAAFLQGRRTSLDEASGDYPLCPGGYVSTVMTTSACPAHKRTRLFFPRVARNPTPPFHPPTSPLFPKRHAPFSRHNLALDDELRVHVESRDSHRSSYLRRNTADKCTETDLRIENIVSTHPAYPANTAQHSTGPTVAPPPPPDAVADMYADMWSPHLPGKYSTGSLQIDTRSIRATRDPSRSNHKKILIVAMWWNAAPVAFHAFSYPHPFPELNGQ